MNTTTDVNTDLIATCWTSAGNVTPMAASEKSAFDIQDRVREVAATGWSGIGIAHDDLKHIVETIGFPALRESIAAAGLKYTEVELIDNWWEAADTRQLAGQTCTAQVQEPPPPLRARQCWQLSAPWTATHFGPPPVAPASFASASVACSITLSMLKLDGFCRGGNSLKLFTNSPTIACAGTSVNIRSAFHFS
jgi:hypothetical protein